MSGMVSNLCPDDEYDGMLIPKDSIVFVPSWALHHDEKLYADHEKFDPGRYQNHEKLASDYAGSSDYAGRDKSPPPSATNYANMGERFTPLR